MSDKNKKVQQEEELEKVQEEPVQEEEKVQEDVQTDDKAKIEQLDNQLKRAVADYINLQRRVDEERREVVKFANRELLLSLLPALDTLFLAGKYTEDEGVKLTVKNILEVLKGVGVEKIPTEGHDFDAKTMEAVDIIEGEDGKVIEEAKAGFSLYGKLLSPALVKVGGKKEASSN